MTSILAISNVEKKSWVLPQNKIGTSYLLRRQDLALKSFAFFSLFFLGEGKEDASSAFFVLKSQSYADMLDFLNIHNFYLYHEAITSSLLTFLFLISIHGFEYQQGVTLVFLWYKHLIIKKKKK